MLEIILPAAGTLFFVIPLIAAPIAALMFARKGKMIGLTIFDILIASFLLIWFYVMLGLGGFFCPPLYLLSVSLTSIFVVASGIIVLKKREQTRKVIVRLSVLLIAVALFSLVCVQIEGDKLYNLDYASVMIEATFMLFPLIINLIILSRPKVKKQFK